jgi:hypothetical protein
LNIIESAVVEAQTDCPDDKRENGKKMRFRPQTLRIGNYKYAVKKQFSDAFSTRDIQIILAFFFGMLVSAVAIWGAGIHH